jgi:hypothetical protein
LVDDGLAERANLISNLLLLEAAPHFAPLSGVDSAAMVEVHLIPVPKERLRAMPKEERALFLLLGYRSHHWSNTIAQDGDSNFGEGRNPMRVEK